MSTVRVKVLVLNKQFVGHDQSCPHAVPPSGTISRKPQGPENGAHAANETWPIPTEYYCTSTFIERAFIPTSMTLSSAICFRETQDHIRVKGIKKNSPKHSDKDIFDNLTNL